MDSSLQQFLYDSYIGCIKTLYFTFCTIGVPIILMTLSIKTSLLLLFFLCIASPLAFSQSAIDSIFRDSLFSRPAFKSFIHKQLTQLGVPDKETLLSHLSVFKTFDKQSLPPIHGSVGLEYFWNQGDSLLYGNATNQSFSYITPDLTTSVLGVPARIGGNIVFQNQTWRRDLSTYTFQLDYEALLAKKKQQIRDLALQEKMKTWSKEEIAIWKSRAQWDVLYNIVFTPEFQAKKQKLEHQLDSLRGFSGVLKDSVNGLRSRVEREANHKIEQTKDSIRVLIGQTKDSISVLVRDKIGELKDSISNKAQPAKDSIGVLTSKINSYKTKALDYTQQALKKKTALETELKDYTDAQKQANKLLTYYEKNSTLFAKADSLKATVEKLETEWANRKAKLAALKTGFKDVATQKLQKFMGSIEQLEVGSVLLTNSDLTVRSLLLNGVRFQTQSGKVYNEIAFGKQNTATRDYMVGFQTINGARDLNRYVAYLRGGIGSKDSNFMHVSLTRILDNYKDTVPTVQRPHYNDLLGISIRGKLGKQADLVTELVYSIFQNNVPAHWTSSPEVEVVKQTPKDYGAFQIKLKAIEGNTWQWSLGYDYIGTKFTTLGNPYLLNNRQILRGAFGKTFWQQKLTVKLAYDKNIGLPSSLNWQPHVDQTGFSAELGMRYGRNNRFVAKLAPRYFLISAAGGTEGVGRNDVYTIQNTWQGKIKTMQWLSFINLTNINTLMPLRDSGRLSGFNYVFMQNMLMINNKWTLSALGNLGLEGTLKTATIREATAQLNSQWTMKNGTFSFGVQSFKTVTGDRQLGGNLSGSIKAPKLGIFGLQFSYRESTQSNRSDLNGHPTVSDNRPILSGQTFYKFSF
jgi:hypothetical protein